MSTENTEAKGEQNQSTKVAKRTGPATTRRTGNHVLRDEHKRVADAYCEQSSVTEASNVAGIPRSTCYRILRRADVRSYIEDVSARATERAGITKADVIARTAEILDIALCRRPLRTDIDGEPVYLTSPNLTIAARMVERLGDAVSAWAQPESERPAGTSIGTLILGGDAAGSLADVLIDRIAPPAKTLDHQPNGEDGG